ncbi:MAG: hypothetical protein WBP10_15190 [Thermoanaerobaculia bacterium]
MLLPRLRNFPWLYLLISLACNPPSLGFATIIATGALADLGALDCRFCRVQSRELEALRSRVTVVGGDLVHRSS